MKKERTKETTWIPADEEPLCGHTAVYAVIFIFIFIFIFNINININSNYINSPPPPQQQQQHNIAKQIPALISINILLNA